MPLNRLSGEGWREVLRQVEMLRYACENPGELHADSSQFRGYRRGMPLFFPKGRYPQDIATFSLRTTIISKALCKSCTSLSSCTGC